MGIDRGLKCGLSGNPALLMATLQSDLKGNRQKGQPFGDHWESLLDLSRSIYPVYYRRCTWNYFLGGKVLNKNLQTGITMGISTFFIAILVVAFSRLAVANLTSFLATIVFLLIIATGVVFDMIGVAAAAADVAPFNARAARKDFGARTGLQLVQNADRVATFCSDIVGDICGTVSGALGAMIVVRLAFAVDLSEAVLNITIVALAAALTVGGKGFCKGIGINRANEIIGFVGNFIAIVQGFNPSKRKGGRSK